MATRLTQKAINSELTKRGQNARPEKASDCFFLGCEATDWIDRTVQVPSGQQPDDGAVDGGVPQVEEAECGHDVRGRRATWKETR
jgi:hypothetical protein